MSHAMNEDEQVIRPPVSRDQRMQDYRIRIRAKLQEHGVSGDELERCTDELLHRQLPFDLKALMQ
jgi:hypothetical protein